MKTLKQTFRGTSRQLRYWAHPIGRARLLRLGGASLILWSALLPVLTFVGDVHAYRLSSAANHIVGAANSNLSAKFSYDQQNDVWQFNKDGQAVQAAAIAKQQGTSASDVGAALTKMQAQVGGGGKKDTSLYSVDLPTKAASGMTFYDNQTSQSFSLIPQFKIRDGKNWQGRVVYPFSDSGQIVYTAKTNGIKEDIVLNKNIGDSQQFSYKLQLPSTLEAKIRDDGSLGVYSADPLLYSNVTYGSSADQAKVDSARQTAVKDHLAFVLPAPLIKDQTGQAGRAYYDLADGIVTVHATQLAKLHYPLSVDPSVVVTTSNDFATGNNEGLIDYASDGQINRSMVSGGDVGTSSTTAAISETLERMMVTTYNGYIYRIGGGYRDTSSGNIIPRANVEYAPLTSDGSAGAWVTTTTLPAILDDAAVNVYNGYIYVAGGAGSPSLSSTVYFVQVNANGSLGTWQTTTALPYIVKQEGSAVYNGYLYNIGGSPVSSCTNNCLASVMYAPINANGTLGAWQATTALPTGGRQQVKATAYNGYIYGVGGGDSAGFSNVIYAKINSDGSVGAWLTPSNLFTSSRYGNQAAAFNGYLYMWGGWTGGTGYKSDIQFAPINANGDLGKWQTASNSLTAGKYYIGGIMNNGYLYTVGGYNGTSDTATVEYTKVKPAGAISNYTTSTALGSGLAGINSGRTNGATAINNGCIYLLGGYNGTATRPTQVYQATISAAGVIGTWSVAANPILQGNQGFGFAVYNGYMYMIGGTDGTNTYSTVQYASFNATGCGTSAWTNNPTPLPNAFALHGATAYNGYLYTIGGVTAGNASAVVSSAPINSDGSVGSWTAQASLNHARVGESLLSYGGYLYAIGGIRNSPNTPLTSVEYIQITGPGTLAASWTDTSSLNTGRMYTSAYIYNGYMYVIGGFDFASTYYNTTEYVKINADGSLGGGAGSSWTYNTTLADTYEGGQIASFDDKVYLVSGLLNGARTLTVHNLTTNTGGSGYSGAWTTNTTDTSSVYANGTSGGGAFTYGKYAYVIGGYNASSGRAATVASAPLNDDGSVGSWTNRGSMNAAKNLLVTSVYNGYVYAYTGATDAGATNTYEYAKLGPNGTIGAWSAELPMNTSSGSVPLRQAASGIAYRGKLYVMGGSDGSSTTYNDVYYAPLNADGSVGSWVATTSFSGARLGQSTVAYNGYLYNIGGRDAAAGNYLNDVQYAVVNSNGTVSSWQTTTSLLQARSQALAQVSNGHVYIYTGSNAVGGLTAVEQAPLNANGTLGNWERSGGNAFTTARSLSQGFLYAGRLYLLGGVQGTSYYADTQYSALMVIGRVGTYSKLINLGSNGTLAAVYYNGSLSPESSVQYRTAGADGVLANAGTAVAGSGPAPFGTCTLGATQYVWVSVTLDDSQSMTYGGASISNLTDITATYVLTARPDPSVRLYGGKSFSNEVLQPLDTCGA